MVAQLGKYSIRAWPDCVEKHLSQFKFKFNPSFVKNKESNYLAIRVCKVEEEGIQALIYEWDDSGKYRLFNLSNHCHTNHGLSKVSDPKLFKIGHSVYCTFNTGHIENKSNQLFLFEIKDFEKIDIKECKYSERKRIEKNWSFFERNNELCALYSINPLKILKGTALDGGTINFNELYCEDSQLPQYSIASPMVQISKNKYVMISHKKLVCNNKRLYLGLPLIFNAKERTITRSRSTYLIHSFTSLFGSKFKFNKNLISCTYFSGIDMNRNNFILSYGINDIDMRIVSVNRKLLI